MPKDTATAATNQLENLDSPLRRKLPVTFFADRWAKESWRKEMTLEEIADYAERKTARSKDKLPLIKLALFGDDANDKGCLRHNENMTSISGIEADYDGEVISAGEAADTLHSKGIAALIYTSPSHRPEAPRWRVLCPLSEDLDPSHREWMLSRLNGALGGILGGESFNLSQAFYIGGVTGNLPEIIDVSGDFIDRREDLDTLAIGRPNRADVSLGGAFDLDAGLDAIRAGEAWHDNARDVIAHLAAIGRPEEEIEETIRAAFDEAREGLTGKRLNQWHDRVRDLPRTIKGAMRKFAPDLAGEFDDITEAEEAAISADARRRKERERRARELIGYSAEDNISTGLVFTDLADLEGHDVPPREWLINGWVPWHQVTGLYGDGGTGKSLLALQMAVAVGTGRPWLGLPVDKPGKVLVIGAEDEADEMHRRFGDILNSEGLRFADCPGVKFASLFGADAILGAADRDGRVRPTQLLKRLRKAIELHRPRLVILDTLADLFSGVQNDQSQARQFIGLLRGIALDFDCAVLLLAHPSQTGMNTGTGTSGSVAWNNSLRSRLYFSRIKDDQGNEPDICVRQLVGMKANYGPTGDSVFVRWHRGAFIDQIEAPSNKERRSAEGKFLDLLDWHLERGLPVSPAKGLNYAPTKFAAHPEAGGFSQRAFAEAMTRLLSSREIEQASERVNGKDRNILRRDNIAREFAEDD